MRKVVDRGTPEIDDPGRLAPPQEPVATVGVDETAYLRALHCPGGLYRK
jgi:hypothetical protein